MTKQQKQTRKRAHQTNGASGENVKQPRPQTRDREGSKSGVNYLRVCVGVVVLCVVCTVVLLWNMPSFHSGDHSTQQDIAQKGESHETNPPRKLSKRSKKGIRDIYYVIILLNSVY